MTDPDSGNQDRDERSNRLRNRFDDKTSKTDQTEQTDQAEQTERKDKSDQADQNSVKDRPSVLMYLPEETKQELSIRFDELNAKHKREHGEPIEKNRDFYPAVVKSGLTGKDLEDILDL